MARGSIAAPLGMGLGIGGGGVGKTRPGWEGDEVVGVLRGSGLEGKSSFNHGPVLLFVRLRWKDARVEGRKGDQEQSICG